MNSNIRSASRAAAIVFPFIDQILAIRDDLPQVRTYLCNGENGTLISKPCPPATARRTGGGRLLYDPNLILYTWDDGRPGAVLPTATASSTPSPAALDYRFTRTTSSRRPPVHAAAVNCMLLPGLVLGCTVAIHLRFDPEDMLRTIQQEAVTVTWGPAILWRTLLAWPEFAKYDVRSVRLLGNGGMAMTGEMREKLLARFPRAAMMDIYGMTGLSPAATLLRRGGAKSRSPSARPWP